LLVALAAMLIWAAPKRLITSPRIVVPLPPPAIVNPIAFAVALVPFSSMIGVPEKPACDVPSTTTGSLIVGSAEPGVIVKGAVPAMSKKIRSGPA